jgi:hypothetical protein
MKFSMFTARSVADHLDTRPRSLLTPSSQTRALEQYRLSVQRDLIAFHDEVVPRIGAVGGHPIHGHGVFIGPAYRLPLPQIAIAELPPKQQAEHRNATRLTFTFTFTFEESGCLAVQDCWAERIDACRVTRLTWFGEAGPRPGIGLCWGERSRRARRNVQTDSIKSSTEQPSELSSMLRSRRDAPHTPACNTP